MSPWASGRLALATTGSEGEPLPRTSMGRFSTGSVPASLAPPSVALAPPSAPVSDELAPSGGPTIVPPSCVESNRPVCAGFPQPRPATLSTETRSARATCMFRSLPAPRTLRRGERRRKGIVFIDLDERRSRSRDPAEAPALRLSLRDGLVQ